MANTIISANMGMPVPVPGVETGPQYALDLNACLAIIDSHDHASGSGVQITPAGLNINADLPLSGNNLTMARSLRLSVQDAPISESSDLGCLYVTGVDLYFNDENGNQIQITQSGGVAGSPGSISNLTSPASAAYVSADSTFVWQSAASTPANLDGASFILRNLSASSKGLTLAPPNSMASDYQITLPSLPGSSKFVSMSSSGTMSAAWSVDGTTLQFSGNSIGVISVPDGVITHPKITTPSPIYSSSCGSASTASTTPVPVTNLTLSFTSSGSKPVMVGIVPDGSGIAPGFFCSGLIGTVIVNKDGTEFGRVEVNQPYHMLTPIWFLATPSAGAHTYSVTMKVSSGALTLTAERMALVVYEPA